MIPPKHFHVEVRGERVASFLLLEDALFFARTGREANYFGQGVAPFVTDSRGHQYGYEPMPKRAV